MKKQVNLECLRVVVMLLIISGHFMIHGNVLYNATPGTLNYIIALWFTIIIYQSANCYILISSYFLITSKFKLKKLVSIWIQVAFYSAIIYLILSTTEVINFSIKNFIFSLLPIYKDQYWFVTCYFGTYLLSPLLNIIIKNIDESTHRKIVIIGLILLSALPTLLYFTDVFNINKGYSLLWFLYLYFVGSYLRLHYKPTKNTKQYGKIYLIISLFTLVFVLVAEFFLKALNITQKHIFYHLILNYNSIIMLFATLTLFLAFKQFKITNKKWEKIIGILSPLTFGVYLIHDNSYIRNWLWNTLLQPSKYVNNYKIWLLFLLSIPIIYLSCSLIEYIRQQIFKIIRIDKLVEINSKKMEKTFTKILNLTNSRKKEII